MHLTLLNVLEKMVFMANGKPISVTVSGNAK